jgi:hypothetical protein
MSDLPIIPSMRPEPARDAYGRYLLPNVDNQSSRRAYTRATTVAHTLSDEHLLTQWKRRMVAIGISRDPDLVRTAYELGCGLDAVADDWRAAKELKKELDGLCDSAATLAGADCGSSLGTLLHTITEYLDAGRMAEINDLIPEELWPDVAAYEATMNAAGIRCPVEWIERICVNSTIGSAGTWDRLLQLPDGRLVIGDLKTQKTVDFGWLEIAIQLAEYAYADALFDPEAGTLGHMPDGIDRRTAIVMHLPVGSAKCTLWEIDIVRGWRYAKLAAEVRAARKDSKALGQVYQATRPARIAAEPSSEPGDPLLYLIRNATHTDALTGLWRNAGPGEWTEAHTTAAAARKAELLAEKAEVSAR